MQDSRIPARLRLARCKKANEISHVTTADKKTAAVGLITDHFCNPAYCLRFNFARYGQEWPRGHIRIDGGGQQIAQGADGRGR